MIGGSRVSEPSIFWLLICLTRACPFGMDDPKRIDEALAAQSFPVLEGRGSIDWVPAIGCFDDKVELQIEHFVLPSLLWCS